MNSPQIVKSHYFLNSQKSDFHIHTIASDGNEECTPNNIVKVAEGLGFQEIGFADHAHVCGEGVKGNPCKNGDFVEAYFNICKEIRQIQTPLNLYVSWEVDYFDGGSYSFDPDKHFGSLDYVLLAHHYYEHMQGESAQILANYMFRIYMEMAIEPYANIIAHPFYVFRPPDPGIHGAILSKISNSQFLEVFHAMKENGKAAEVSSYQFSANARDVEQTKRMYGIAKESGVKFTLNSDAHTLAEIGNGYRCIHILYELGFLDSDFVNYSELMRL